MTEKINVQDIVRIAKEAGKEILKIYNKNFSVDYKDDKSPLTEADKASHTVIEKELSTLYPTIQVLSEEGKDIAYEERKNWHIFWLVDPLDGTKEFISKNGEFTVNIALIEDGKPILGVVYAPVKEITYYADENGSFKQEKENPPKKLEPIKTEGSTLRVVASRSHFTDETKKYIENLGKKYELVSVGSSLKICLVAEGKADIYPRLGSTMEWDTAAAHAIISGVKKKIVDYYTKKELMYNKEDLLNQWFVVI